MAVGESLLASLPPTTTNTWYSNCFAYSSFGSLSYFFHLARSNDECSLLSLEREAQTRNAQKQLSRIFLLSFLFFNSFFHRSVCLCAYLNFLRGWLLRCSRFVLWNCRSDCARIIAVTERNSLGTLYVHCYRWLYLWAGTISPKMVENTFCHCRKKFFYFTFLYCMHNNHTPTASEGVSVEYEKQKYTISGVVNMEILKYSLILYRDL